MGHVPSPRLNWVWRQDKQIKNPMGWTAKMIVVISTHPIVISKSREERFRLV